MLPFLRPTATALALALFAALLTACGNSPTTAASGKPIVVCTIFSYFDAARAIAGDAADVQILLAPAVSPHDYETSTRDIKTVANAKLYIKNGMGLDDRFDKLIEGRNIPVLTISTALPKELILSTAEVSLDPNDTAAAAPSTNPHIWLDPQVQIKAAEKIRDALIAAFPASKDTFDANAKTYIASLEQLDKEFKEAAQTFKTREFIGFHSAYDYLARRYGLKQIASIEELPGAGLNVAQAKKIIKLIEDHHIKYIAMETALNGQGAKLIIDSTGVKTFTLQPIETYDSLQDSYVSLMRSNLDALKSALGG